MNNEDFNKRFFISWSCNLSNYLNNAWTYVKTTEQLLKELDEVDETISVMEKYPTAERMLSTLLSKK